MKKNILLIFMTLIVLNIYSQETIDYIKLKKDIYGVSCMNVNKTNVDSTLVNLLKIDTASITKGLEEYYYDLALMYNFKGVYYKEKRVIYFTEAINYNLRCIHLNKKNTAAYNNLALIYIDTKQIDKAKETLSLYKKYTRHKYWDKSLIKQIEEAK